jgi:hypothetical protein
VPGFGIVLGPAEFEEIFIVRRHEIALERGLGLGRGDVHLAVQKLDCGRQPVLGDEAGDQRPRFFRGRGRA